MKKILLIAVLLSALQASAQKLAAPITISKGTSLYVTINGQDYPRNGYLGFTYTYNAHDSQVLIYYNKDKSPMVVSTVDTNFKWGDSSNAKVRNMPALRAWLQSNAY